MKREQIKALIELSNSFEEADEVIQKYAGFKTTKEKIAFIKGMFDVKIISHPKDILDEDVYRLLLTAVVESKWNS